MFHLIFQFRLRSRKVSPMFHFGIIPVHKRRYSYLKKSVMFYLVERGKEKYVSHYWGCSSSEQLKEERKFCSKRKILLNLYLGPFSFWVFSVRGPYIVFGPPDRNLFWAVERSKQQPTDHRYGPKINGLRTQKVPVKQGQNWKRWRKNPTRRHVRRASIQTPSKCQGRYWHAVQCSRKSVILAPCHAWPVLYARLLHAHTDNT